MRAYAVALVVLWSLGLAVAKDLPGATDPRVSQETIDRTICRRGWVRSVRPPVKSADLIKRQLMIEEGIANSADVELDHIVPLSLGGAPLDLKNLQLQPWHGPCNAKQKDVLEVELSKAVCAGLEDLEDARAEIAKDWQAAYRDWIDPRGCE
jgi:hypothetical protein